VYSVFNCHQSCIRITSKYGSPGKPVRFKIGTCVNNLYFRYGRDKKKVVGLERGPLSLVSPTEELLDRKVAAPV
jgi:hypothetical protein